MRTFFVVAIVALFVAQSIAAPIKGEDKRSTSPYSPSSYLVFRCCPCTEYVERLVALVRTTLIPRFVDERAPVRADGADCAGWWAEIAKRFAM